MHFGSTVFRRLAIAGVCVLSLVLCCGLAWWQWERFSSAGGTYQNLGYVLQWPLFGLFPAFMFWRIRVLSRRAAEEQAASENGADGADDADGAVGERVRTSGRREWGHSPPPADAVPAQSAAGRRGPADDGEPDDELAAYNRYLAELHRRDQQDR
ncbi:hypothetical protein SAMN05216266_112171 [Amycolatopsis marina]|uniref:DNA-binding transcriptional regulator of glucitol operon n=1 Tax=Amycolatopsis marina TaxID=490629 RepID=A0A1I1B894_9PSEU|nr:hypothetical protein [Amycolatopsis marina]SFB46287.1 hypothetical protein SAMN05216266_112171 [Amycolatopsis marina]